MIQYKVNSLLRNNSEKTVLKKENIMDLLKNHLSIDEINNNPTLSSALNNKKSLRFNLLSQSEYKIIPSLIKIPKKQRLINSIDTFRKIYCDYNKNVKISSGEINNLSKESNKFINNYNNIMLKTSKKNLFLDVKAEYDKQNYNLPDLYDGKNIFQSSLLLSNRDTEIKKYIIYGYGNKASNEKTITFLKKMDEGLDNFDNKRDLDQKRNYNSSFKIKHKLKKINRKYNTPISLYTYHKIPKETLKDILTYKKDIKKLERTINSIQDIDFFFNSDNKDYLETLKYFHSRNTSANFSTSLGNNNSTFFDKKNTSNLSSFLNFKNISKYTFDEKGSNSNKNERKKIQLNIGANTANFFSGNNSIENNSSIKLVSAPKKKKLIKKKHISKNNANYRKNLEDLYDKIANANDTMTYDKKIKSFLNIKEYKITPKTTKYNICSNMEELREKFLRDKSIKKVIDFRKNLGNIFKYDKEKPELEKKIYGIQEQMVNAFSEFKN